MQTFNKTMVFSVVLASLISGVAGAQVTFSGAAHQESSSWSYEYALMNEESASVFAVELVLPVSVTSQDLITPSEWVADVHQSAGYWIVSWTAALSGVPSGSQLTGFGLKSSVSPGTVVFQAIDENFNSYVGDTVGPVPNAVPEPVSVCALGLGAVCLWTRRKQ